MQFINTYRFKGRVWSVSDIKITKASGFVTVEACPTPADGSAVPEPAVPGSFMPCTPPLLTSMAIGSGQWGVEMLFDWTITTNIDVLIVWAVTVNADG